MTLQFTHVRFEVKTEWAAALPPTSEQVWADRQNEEFVVLRSSPELLTADLLSVEQVRRPGEDFPWLSFSAFRKPSPKPLN